MHQFVQSAIEAAKQGDNTKALAFLKQVLNANPNDVDAWLVLAAVLDDPARKRQCLNRVLKLDPVNQVAREELLEMDRAEMGGTPTFTPGNFDEPAASSQGEPVPASTPLYQSEATPAFYSTGTSAFEPEALEQPSPQAKTQPQAAPSNNAPAKKQKEKALVFQFPLFWRIVMYVIVVLFGCVGLLVATQDLLPGLFFMGFAVLSLVGAWTLSPKVEVSESGIRVSSTFSTRQTRWDEIAKMKSNSMKRRLELTKRNGEVVNVSTQVSGYPQIVEILRKRRPDLFGAGQPRPQTQTSAFDSSSNDRSSVGYADASPAAPSFKGTKTFSKSLIKQYGSLLVFIPALMYSAYTLFTQPQYRFGAGISTVVCLILIVLPFLQISSVKLQPNKLTVESIFEEKVFSPKDIREIKMESVRGRYGRVTNYVNIVTTQGKNYPLQGFSEGEEIIYGILMNWWSAHDNG